MSAITIKDVAARAGVSPKTVSRVINGEQHVRAAVREAVLRVVAELDYKPNAFARSLSSSRSYLLGLLIDDPASSYAADVQLGALMRCRAQSYHLVVEPVDRRAADWAAGLRTSFAALHLDGAILTPPLCDDPAVLEVLESENLPYVRISPKDTFGRSGVVRMDDRAAAADMTRHLIDLGHRRIGFLKGDPAHSASIARFEGFRTAMAAAGLGIGPSTVLQGDFSFRSGLELGEALLRRADAPTAIFASNDEMAVGVLMAAGKLRLDVPGEVSIAGFDDAPWSRAAWPQLTTVRQPMAEMAAAAVDILVDRQVGKIGGRAAVDRLLDYSLIVRGSTGPARRS